MARLAGQKLRASMLAGTATNQRLLGTDVALPAGTVVKASQIP